MANTSTIHIKTDFDCIVYDYDQELGTTKADTFCSFELRKGEHELTFALAEDKSVFKTISYLVECVDCDYQLIVAIANELCGKAKEYYHSENYSSAYTLFVLAAEKGYAEAQNGLGLCYLNGHGIKENIANAWKWIKKAAEQEHVDAQYNYGILWSYEASYGGLDEAAKWWSKAAEQGHTKAQFELGHYYLKIEWSPIKALEWLLKAAEQGDKEAQHELISCYYKLGSCYEEGNGVEKDLDKAVEWYTKAAEQGNVNAQYNLGHCYYEGKGVNRDLYKAIEWYKKAEKQGAEVGIELSCCYDELSN